MKMKPPHLFPRSGKTSVIAFQLKYEGSIHDELQSFPRFKAGPAFSDAGIKGVCHHCLGKMEELLTKRGVLSVTSPLAAS